MKISFLCRRVLNVYQKGACTDCGVLFDTFEDYKAHLPCPSN